MTNVLLNPVNLTRPYPDQRSSELMKDTVAFFQNKGKDRLLKDYYSHVWYGDFLEHVKEHRLFATMCTPCLLYTSPSPRDLSTSRMPSSA